jgi:hypothetical protein
MSKMAKIGKLVMLPLILVVVCVINQPANAETSIYVFDPNHSIVIRSGGIAGIQKTFTIDGQFQLTVDSGVNTASFETVDTSLTDEIDSVYGQSLDEIFNMTGLAGTVIDDMTIEFEGKAADGTQSNVNLTLTFSDGMAHLAGQYTPPPDSADIFFYDVNAVAARKYAGGTGEPNEPYLICTPGQLNTIGAELGDWDKHFKLMADIDLQEYSEEQFNIIGTMRDKFVGSFDGAGFTISNFSYSAGNKNFIGLFSQVGVGAQIKDLTLDNIEIEVEKGSSVGALVGFNLRGIISGCRISGNVIGGDGSGNLGTLVGFNSWGTVSNCSAAGSVTGASNVASIGGLVGNNAHGDIYDCTATTMVSGGPGSSNIGGLVGYSEAGTISNSFAAGNVSGDTSLGGLVGYKNDGSIIQCYAIGDVSGNTRLGGLVGRNDSGSISDCYTTCSINGDDALGGLVGRNHKGSVSYCYAAGTVNGNNRLGGLVGNEDRGSYISSFWDTNANPGLTGAGDIDPDPNDIVGRTRAEMQTESTFLEAGWDFVGEITNSTEDIWKITEGLSYPRLSWQKYSGGTGKPNNPYQIATLEDLMLLGETPEDYDKNFILTDNVDLDPNLPDRKVFDRAVIAPDINDAGDGFQGATFTGVFDGDGYTITNLTISGRRYLGLFGQLGLGAMISNLGLEAIDVNGTSDYIGGLAGYNEGHITKNYSTGMVHGDDGIGGLLGDNLGYVTECYSAGLVKGDESVGGLVGENYGSITTSYSTCMVSGWEKVGGLSGYSSYSGQIIRCFSTGLVTGTEYVGGLASGNDANITDCFWNMETSGQDTSVGGEGKTTAEMQTASTFLEAGWDFVGETENGTEDIWWILEGQDYPRLWWELSDL